jgi:hypothetical protein
MRITTSDSVTLPCLLVVTRNCYDATKLAVDTIDQMNGTPVKVRADEDTKKNCGSG